MVPPISFFQKDITGVQIQIEVNPLLVGDFSIPFSTMNNNKINFRIK